MISSDFSRALSLCNGTIGVQLILSHCTRLAALGLSLHVYCLVWNDQDYAAMFASTNVAAVF